MAATVDATGSDSLAPPRPRVVGHRLVLWFVLGVPIALGVAQAASWAERLWAPFLLLPLATGAVLGLASAVAARLCPVGHRPAALVGLALLTGVTVASEHYLSYRRWDTISRQQREAFDEARLVFAELAERELPPRPETFPAFLLDQAERGRPWLGSAPARGGWAWFSWALDAAATLGGAWGVAWVAWSVPFCPGCQSWYRAVQSGRRAGRDAAALLQAAGAAEIATETRPRELQFRLLRCRAGCEPSALQLSWHAVGRSGGRESRRVWLDRPQRRAVMDCLDQPLESHAGESEREAGGM